MRVSPQLAINRLLTARARNRAAIRRGKSQQLGQRARPGLMHDRAHQHLDCLQIEATRLAHAGENSAQQLFYFARDFLLDGVRRFFSCGVSVSSTGRRRQIFSFTSRKERLRS